MITNDKYKEKVLTSSIITSTALLLGLYLNNGSVVKADNLSTNQDTTQTSNSTNTVSGSSNAQNENSVTQDSPSNISQTSESETTNELNQSKSEAGDLTRSVKTFRWSGIDVTFDDSAGVLTIPGGTDDAPLILSDPIRIYGNLYGPGNSSFGRYDVIKEIRISGKIKLKGSLKRLFGLNWVNTISGLDQLDTSEVTDMSSMFEGCNNVTSLDVSHFNTSKVSNMSNMFDRCSKITSLDIGGFDTTNVTDMSHMFSSCSNLTNLDIAKFKTSQVIDMSSMFDGCSKLTDVDVSHFDTSKVTNMSNMFSNCSSLSNINVDHFDTSKVTNMLRMFFGCSALTNLDVSHFDTGNVTNMSQMFDRCSKITNLDVSHFDTGNATNMSYMFDKCSKITNLDVSHFDTSKVTNMGAMFSECASLTNVDISHFDTSKVTNMSNMFSRCSALTNLDVSHFDTGNVTDMSYMFSECSALTNLDVSHFDTGNVTNMSYMFKRSKRLPNIDVSHFDTGKVTNMSGMFSECSALTNLDVSHFDTGNVTDMSGMFEFCVSLKSLDVSHFNTSKVMSIGNMFTGMNLTKLDLSSFDMGRINPSNYWSKTDMLAGLWKLKILVLGPKCDIKKTGMDQTAAIHPLNPDSNWINVADGTVEKPKGDTIWKPAEMMANYNGYTDADTYVRFGIVKAHYQDKDGNEIASDQEVRGLINEDYTSVTKLNIPGYTLKEVQGDNTGIYGDSPKEVTYIYTKKAVTPSRPVTRAKVIVHYQDENGSQIASDGVLTGKVGDGYQTIQKTINGHTFKEVIGNATGFFTANEQTVTYIYTKDDETTTTTLPNYVPKPAKPNNTNKLTGTNSQTVTDKNQQKATKPLSDDPNKAKSDSLPQTGASNEDKGILSILGSMLLLISSIGGAWFKRKQK